MAMPKVVITAHGQRHETEVATGLNVLISAWNVGLDEKGFGDCGGNLVCTSCHVRVKSGTFPDMKRDEAYMLETLPQVFADSRLGCQLRISDDCEVEWVG
ncbi:MAG: 2Fe-2S iron-sulfur cluster binding domain-containing protein [Alphaproteobacteria bacterium]|nr:MAG: 2Fe-2S iron-sulfur cluster binding domain-containing protein [Alphaproteobacteria bacterium]